MSKRIAAKFPPKNDNFVNEDLEKAQIEQAIKASLAEIKTQSDPRSLSLSPTTSGSTFNGYSKVTATLKFVKKLNQMPTVQRIAVLPKPVLCTKWPNLTVLSYYIKRPASSSP